MAVAASSDTVTTSPTSLKHRAEKKIHAIASGKVLCERVTTKDFVAATLAVGPRPSTIVAASVTHASTLTVLSTKTRGADHLPISVYHKHVPEAGWNVTWDIMSSVAALMLTVGTSGTTAVHSAAWKKPTGRGPTNPVLSSSTLALGMATGTGHTPIPNDHFS